MIYNILHARVANLHANVQYVRQMRHPDLSHPECDYYFTNLESAVSFIENMDATSLSIDPGTFQQEVESRQRTMPSDAADVLEVKDLQREEGAIIGQPRQALVQARAALPRVPILAAQM